MPRQRSNPEFVNGVPELLILRLLSHRPMYGYELVRAISESTGGRLEFGEGCIYPLLHRLESDGSLTSRRERVGGRSRVVYRVAKPGQDRLRTALARWENVVEGVRTALQGGMHGHARLA